MAQLIKLLDYISRYETDMFRYPGQFIRLKQDNWKKMRMLWEEKEEVLPYDDKQAEQQDSYFSKWKNIFKKKERMEIDERNKEKALPDTEKELKQYFLDGLHPFQLKWASSTVSEMSFLEKYYYYDTTLKYFLQRLPDTYLLMYHPHFRLKNTSMEGDLILISPIGLEIIQLVEKKPNVTIVAGDERTWYTEEDGTQTWVLSPLISLKRTEQVVKSVLNYHNIEFPIKKIVLSRTNNIDFNIEPYNTVFIGAKQLRPWLEEKRSFMSPLKHRQLKASAALLNHCQTTSVKRPEWDEEKKVSEEER